MRGTETAHVMLPAHMRGALTALQRHRAPVRNHETAVQSRFALMRSQFAAM
jgi:hypothetical protein